MTLYKSYKPEPIMEDHDAPTGHPELDDVENFSKLLNDNLNRFLGVPKRIQPTSDCLPPVH
jgi:hypothetical protein